MAEATKQVGRHLAVRQTQRSFVLSLRQNVSIMSGHLDNLNKYFIEKERKKLDKITRETNRGIPTMSFDEIRVTCLENNGYETPELNDKLYLHFKGFSKMENLERYTDCKALWLDSNTLKKLECLETLTGLRSLFVSKNFLTSFEGIQPLVNLVQLDVSGNRIEHIDESILACTQLDSINLSRNILTSVDSVRVLQGLPVLKTLDITTNKLENDEGFIDLFAGIPSLVTLSVNGNETTKIASFRKKMITKIPRMGYLDRPVEDLERLVAEAFAQGLGPEGEQAARDQFREDKAQKRRDDMEAYKKWQQEQRDLRANMSAEKKAALKKQQDERAALLKKQGEEEAAREKKALETNNWGYILNENYTESPQVEEISDEQYASYMAEKNKSVETVKEEVEAEGEKEEDVVVKTETQTADAFPPAPPVDTTTINNDSVKKVDLPPTAPVVVEKKETEAKTNPTSQIDMNAVAESTRMFLEQQNLTAETITKATQDNIVINSTFGHDGPSGESKSDKDLGTMYWSEMMDIELAKQVSATIFDFDAVAVAMEERFSEYHGWSADIVRERWSHLDAEQWCEAGVDGDPLATIHKSYVTDAALIEGKGWDELASTMRGKTPTYLNVPLEFPSVADQPSDDEED